jgi:hypothetical protein
MVRKNSGEENLAEHKLKLKASEKLDARKTKIGFGKNPRKWN